MKGDTAQRLYDLVARALEEKPERRREWIEGACGGNAALRDEVLRVVGADEGLKEFLATPAPARFDALKAPGPPLPLGATVGRYHLKRVLGSGGSGAVYEALQESPHRKVALKVMAAGLGSTGAMNRFREEAEILARMSHPGVAHVYEAGVHREGGTRLPWLAIEYVEGRDIVAHAAGLDVRARLALMARVCDAVHHGHEQGILHGDLKPTNILVDAAGAPKVIDFGIARALGVDGDQEIAGTPPYMSPEQCQGGRLDVRSDVYALGAVLYELLAGRRVRDVSDLPLASALRAVLEEAPVPLERVNRRFKGDLAAIVGKALARDRGARYASAAALADDLRRHLAHRPVEARHHGALYVAGKFARRQPLVALLAVAIVALSVAAALVGTRLAWQKERERQVAERQAYIASLAAASAALRAHDVAEARQQLQRAPEPLRGWEWRHLVGRLDDSVRTIALPGRTIANGTMSTDGARAFAITMPGPTVQGLDLATGHPLFSEPTSRPSALAADAHGTRIAVGQVDGTVEIRDGTIGALLVRTEGHEGAVNGVAFDPSGLVLASAGRDRTVRLSDVATGAAIGIVGEHEDRAICVSFDGPGERLASGGREGTVRIWDLATRTLIATLKGHEGSVEGVAWSPDGRRLASVSRDRTVRLWDVETGTPLAVRHGHENNVRDVAFAPDGKTFATCSWDRTLRLWGGDDGRALSCLLGHDTLIRSVFFLPGDSRIVTFANEIKFWRMETREEVPVLWQPDLVRSLAFVPGGKLLASASHDGAVRLWDVASRREVASVSAPHRRIDQIAIAGDGSALLTLANGYVRLWAFDEALRGGAPGR
ncbi:MAG: WD40 repeat domain-containing serine/threonine protein kinase, partial [Planctomycetota bacterium]